MLWCRLINNIFGTVKKVGEIKRKLLRKIFLRSCCKNFEPIISPKPLQQLPDFKQFKSYYWIWYLGGCVTTEPLGVNVPVILMKPSLKYIVVSIWFLVSENTL